MSGNSSSVAELSLHLVSSATIVVLVLVLAAAVVSGSAQGIPSAPKPSGVYCFSAPDGKPFHLLVLRPTSAQGLDFGFSMWTADGSHCGVTGRAKRSGDGWKYVNGTVASSDYCAVTITSSNGDLQITAEPGACANTCGSRARLEKVMFPASSKVNDSVPAALMEPETLFNADCNAVKR